MFAVDRYTIGRSAYRSADGGRAPRSDRRLRKLKNAMRRPSGRTRLASALLASLLCVSIVAQSGAEETTLGSGRLGAGAIGLFSFTLGGDQQANDTLAIDTIGSTFDTEIALYDARGRLVDTHDDVNPDNPLSRLSFGGTQALAAGDYHAVISGFNTLFRDGDIVPGTSQGGDFRLTLRTTRPVHVPVPEPKLAKDGNILAGSIRETELGRGTLASGAVQRFDFRLDNDIKDGDWFAIHTYRSTIDTEIGLYDASGRLLATNDDVVADNLLSRLSFGLDGDNGRSLPAGDYSLLLGGFNTIFRDGWNSQTSFTGPGDYAVYVQQSSGTTPPPAATPGVEAPSYTGPGDSAANGQQSSGTTPPPAGAPSVEAPHTVPEPSSALLTLLGLLILFGSRRYAAKAVRTG